MNDSIFATGYSQPGAPTFELSGWWRRAGAVIVDGILLTIIASIVSGAAGAGFEVGGLSDDGVTAAAVFVYLAVFFVLYVVVMGLNDGRTVGKMALNIRVVREDGEPITMALAFQREFLIKLLMFGYAAIFTLYIATFWNYLAPLSDDQHRALHDRIVKTRVVRDNHIHVPEHFVAAIPPAASSPVPPPPQPPAAPGQYQPPPGFTNPVPPD